MWTKALYDLGLITFDEPFKKLLNQGMITALGYYTRLIYFKRSDSSEGFMYGNDEDLRENKITQNSKGETFIDRDYSDHLVRLPYVGKYLDPKNRITRKLYSDYLNKYKPLKWIAEEDILWIPSGLDESHDYFTVDIVNEKMSKSKINVVNPDDIIYKYGADTFRMYEMFLGPIDQSKPWDTKGIEGVHRFIKKLWRLFFDEVKGSLVTEESATKDELKVLHR
ncbi:MAG: leucine--tRNA ligase, partial [Chitinophagaceae bacterium]